MPLLTFYIRVQSCRELMNVMSYSMTTNAIQKCQWSETDIQQCSQHSWKPVLKGSREHGYVWMYKWRPSNILLVNAEQSVIVSQATWTFLRPREKSDAHSSHLVLVQDPCSCSHHLLKDLVKGPFWWWNHNILKIDNWDHYCSNHYFTLTAKGIPI